MKQIAKHPGDQPEADYDPKIYRNCTKKTNTGHLNSYLIRQVHKN